MAKSKSGGTRSFIRGSVGNETYSIGLDGKGKKQQIIRAKATEVANPRTRAQAAQRMKLMPITYARQLLSNVVNHSFKGIATGTQSLQYFVGINLKETDVPYQTKGSLNREIGGYTIAEGTLGDSRLALRELDNDTENMYGASLPYSAFLNIKFNYSFVTPYVTYAELSQAILEANPSLKDGDEIAVITFVNKVSGSNHSLDLIRRRMVINTSFSADTPSSFKFVRGEGDDAHTYDLNIMWALSQYNDDILPALEEIKAYAGNSSYDVVNLNMWRAYFGFINPKNISGSFLCGGIGVERLTTMASKWPISIDMAFGDNKPIAVALVVSRFENGSWDFTTADIALNEFYLASVSSEARLEAAIASYMQGDVVRSGQDQFFLRLDNGEVIPAAPLSIRGTVGVDGAVTIVTVQGYTDPTTGTKFVPVNDANKILKYAGGPVVQGPTGPETTADMTTANWRKPIDVIFINQNDIVSSN